MTLILPEDYVKPVKTLWGKCVLLIGFVRRNLKVKRAACTRRALDPDVPAVESDQFLCDGQSQAGAAPVALTGIIRAIKTLKNVRGLFSG